MTDSYSLLVKKSAERELRAIPRPDLRRVIDRIKELAPATPGLREVRNFQVRISTGSAKEITGLCIPWMMRNGPVEIVTVGHRREIYR